MKVFFVEWTPRAQKRFKKIPAKDQIKIIRAIEFLAYEPFLCKKLQGSLGGRYSLRVWPYRVIYLVEKERLLVLIVDVGHRQGIYQ
jgi:mRNA interferase RelE/StbE